MKNWKKTKNKASIHRKCIWNRFFQVKEPLNYGSAKADPWYVTNATNTDTQKQDADIKEFAKIADMMTKTVKKLLNVQLNLSAHTVKNDT